MRQKPTDKMITMLQKIDGAGPSGLNIFKLDDWRTYRALLKRGLVWVERIDNFAEETASAVVRLSPEGRKLLGS